MTRKYLFTENTDNLIRDTYRKNTEKRRGRETPSIKDLAASLRIPRWKVSRRAREIGAYEPKIKEPEWSEKEIEILHDSFQKNPEVIKRILKKAGFIRSVTGIIIKRKRLGLLQSLRASEGHYTATSLAGCFGTDSKTVTRWIDKGWLKAKRRGTARTDLQGGDMYEIKEKDIRKFIIENTGVIDIRKVDKFWFVDILAR